MISAAKPPLSPTCSTGPHERSEPAHHLRAPLVNIVATEPDELRAGHADRRPAVAAEVGDRLEVRHQSAGQPHQLDIALALPFEPPARLDAIEIAVEEDLQNRGRMI